MFINKRHIYLHVKLNTFPDNIYWTLPILILWSHKRWAGTSPLCYQVIVKEEKLWDSSSVGLVTRTYSKQRCQPSKWKQMPASLKTFLVSALMDDIIFYSRCVLSQEPNILVH